MNKTNGSILPADLNKMSVKDLMKFTGQADDGQEGVSRRPATLLLYYTSASTVLEVLGC